MATLPDGSRVVDALSGVVSIPLNNPGSILSVINQTTGSDLLRS
jgi:hypothetical protein